MTTRRKGARRGPDGAAAVLDIAVALGAAAQLAVSSGVGEATYLGLARALYARAAGPAPVASSGGRETAARGPWLALVTAAGGVGQLAARLGVAGRSVHRWATGATRPNGAAAVAIRATAAELGAASPV